VVFDASMLAFTTMIARGTVTKSPIAEESRE
jgi:hypothetical protein